MLNLDGICLIFERWITKFCVSGNALCQFPENRAGRHLKAEIDAKLTRYLRGDHPVGLCTMYRRNRLAHALHKTVVVCERAIYLGKRSGWQDDICVSRRFSLKEFLHDEKIEFAQSLFTAKQMFGKKPSHYIHRSNRVARSLQHLCSAHPAAHQAQVVRAHAVVEEGKRMKGNATTVACHGVRELSNQCLCCGI